MFDLIKCIKNISHPENPIKSLNEIKKFKISSIFFHPSEIIIYYDLIRKIFTN